MPSVSFPLNGVCARSATVEYTNDGIITSLTVVGGCNGNLKGISQLVVGMKIDDVIARLEGTLCMSGGRGRTSCPDQIALGLKSIKK